MVKKHKQIIDKFKEILNVVDDELEKAKEELLEFDEDKKMAFRGKNQLDFMVEFIDQLYIKQDKLFLVITVMVEILSK